MSEEFTRLDSPIDAMYLIHKALRTEAARVEKMAEELQAGSSLQPFRLAFNSWAIALGYHADQEDKYLAAPLTNCPPARDCETEHADLGKRLGDLTVFLSKDNTRGLEERVREVMVALQDSQHAQLEEKLLDVMAVLNNEIGKTRLIDRTKRHLFGSVVALRIAQDDHLDNEEAFLLPVVREQLNEPQQLQLVKHLLIDDGAEDSRWVLEWVKQALSPGELQLLAGLEACFQMIAIP